MSSVPPFGNKSLLAQQVLDENFCPQLSAKITTSGTSQSVTFPVTGIIRTTFKITNKGTKGAYIGWGKTTATAVVSSGTPTASCDYIGAGAILTQDFQFSTGVVDTIAAIEGSDTQDNAPTILEISVGFGQ